MNRPAFLLWSLPEEPAFVAHLEDTFESYRIFPLRYTVMRTAQRLFPAKRVGDIAQLVGPQDRERIDKDGLRDFNAFMYGLQKKSADIPWMAGLNLEQASSLFVMLHFWETLLGRLRTEERCDLIQTYGFFSRGAVPGLLLRMASILDFCLASALDEKRFSRKAVLRSMGWFVNRFPQRFSFAPGVAHLSPTPTSLLISGLIESDRRAQAGLTKGLHSANVAFRWLVGTETRLPVSADECALKSAAGGEGVESKTDLLQPSRWMRWSRSIWDMASKEEIVGRLESVLQQQWAGLPRHRISASFARLLADTNPEMRLQYATLERLLVQYQPRRVVISSATDENHILNIAARHHGIPVLRLPHGGEFHFRNHAYCESERIGLMGAMAFHAWKEAGHAPERVFLCGSMHIGQQALSALQRVAAQNIPRESGRVCLLVSPSVFFYPDFNWEVEADLASLWQTLAAMEMTLWVRRHPRQNAWDGQEYESMQQDSGAWQLSNSEESLFDELARSDMAIVRKWSDAALIALYADIPLLGWLPRAGYPESSRLIRGLPLYCETMENLAQTIKALREDGAFRIESVRRQRLYLGQIVDQPWNAPYERAIAEIMNERALVPA